MELTSNEQLLLQNKYSNRDQWMKELSDMKTQLKVLQEATDILKRNNELQLENNSIAVRPENYVMLKPTWKFEEDKTYLKNHREITMINHRLRQMEFDGIIKQRELDYNRVEEQYKGLNESLEKLNIEIKDMEARKGDA